MNTYKLSDRCKKLRDIEVDIKPLDPFLLGQRDYYFYAGAAAVLDSEINNQMAYAAGIASVIDNFPAVIQDGELIVGNNFAEAEWLPGDEATLAKIFADGKITAPGGAAKIYLANREKFWARYTWGSAPFERTQKDNELNAEWAAMGRCIDANHTVLGYEKVLRLGFSGILAEVREAMEQNGANDLLRAMEKICVSACRMGAHYSAEARRLASVCIDEVRKNELLVIAESCGNVPLNPAGNFREAVQSLLFAHIINTYEDTINANSIGRLDQILYPYYKTDLENGILKKEEAFELICCLWLKLYRDYDVQQSCVGGTNPDGSSAVNELSYIMLDITEALGFVRCMSVRYSAETDKKFIQRALEVVAHMKKGVPFFFNDDILIPALEAKGISHTDACDYTQIGCVETVIPGKSNPHAVTGETNLLKALEYALCGGRSMINKNFFPGIKTPDSRTLDTFEKLMKTVYTQIDHILDSSCRCVLRDTRLAETNSPRPYKSLLTENCIRNGLDFNNHGSKYDYYQIMLGGIPNTADSLAAIKEFVYDKKIYTLEQIIYQLENNFPDETLRLELLNKAPKFGNDIDAVDSIAADIFSYSCDKLDEMSVKYGLSFHAQPFTFLWMVDHGRQSAASADGRRSGEVIAYSMSPMQGRDSEGLTALLNSIAKMPALKAPGTTSAIIEIDPVMCTDENIPLLADMFMAASAAGLCNVQFNTVDRETLIDAQKYPEKHKNLAVRVSGFSQKFNLISKELQDHIINRTKHSSL